MNRQVDRGKRNKKWKGCNGIWIQTMWLLAWWTCAWVMTIVWRIADEIEGKNQSWHNNAYCNSMMIMWSKIQVTKFCVLFLHLKNCFLQKIARLYAVMFSYCSTVFILVMFSPFFKMTSFRLQCQNSEVDVRNSGWNYLWWARHHLHRL